MSLGPVLLASTLSALVWNYFFIPPSLTFHIDKTEDVLMFCMFFIIALLNGVLNTKVRKQEKLARERESRTNALFELSRELSKARGIDEVVSVAKQKIKNNFNINACIILQDGNNILLSQLQKNDDYNLTKEEQELAEKAFYQMKITGAYTENFSKDIYTFFPLSGIRLNPGIVAIKVHKTYLNKQIEFWDTFLTQISNALEREFLGEMAQKVRFLDESDRLYKTLFNSISHEFRIPVAAIMGASDTLINTHYNIETQQALFKEIYTASVRLNRLIENLLNMSRLESGFLSVRLDWYDFNDLINKVTEDLNEETNEYILNVSMPENMPLVKLDFGLMRQVLYNLFYNSIQYSINKVTINLVIFYNDNLIIKISDNGLGFPENSLKDVFKKFYKLAGRKSGGLGLGLSIVKGFIEAHKGEISISNLKPHGAEFTIVLPSYENNLNKFSINQND